MEEGWARAVNPGLLKVQSLSVDFSILFSSENDLKGSRKEEGCLQSQRAQYRLRK